MFFPCFSSTPLTGVRTSTSAGAPYCPCGAPGPLALSGHHSNVWDWNISAILLELRIILVSRNRFHALSLWTTKADCDRRLTPRGTPSFWLYGMAPFDRILFSHRVRHSHALRLHPRHLAFHITNYAVYPNFRWLSPVEVAARLLHHYAPCPAHTRSRCSATWEHLRSRVPQNVPTQH